MITNARQWPLDAQPVNVRRATNAIWAPALFTTAVIALWIFLASMTGTAQYADNIEQFVWAQSFETGYWKHPPLPSWILWAVIQLFGAWSGWAYVLSGICFSGAAFFTWRISDDLAGPRVAAIAVLLQGLHLGFSQRAELYNHNTVLVLCSAVTVWATLLALKRRRMREWLLVGAFGGLALLAKYQAAVMLAGIFIALALSGDLRERTTRRGCALAALMAALVLLPHTIGLLAGEVAPMGYALSRFDGNPAGAVLRSLASFFVSQLRFHLPVIATIGLVVLLGRRVHNRAHPAAAVPTSVATDSRQRAWLVGLVLWPSLVLVVVPLCSGLLLQAQWGVHALQFLVLFVAIKLSEAMPGLSIAALFRAVSWVQLGNALVFLGSPVPQDRRVDTAYPAHQVAKAVLHDWQRETRCPLRFLSGPSFEAGIISVYSGSYAKVLEDGDLLKSPWIAPADMKDHGFVSITVKPNSDQFGGEASASRTLPPGLSWSVTPPTRKCDATRGD